MKIVPLFLDNCYFLIIVPLFLDKDRAQRVADLERREESETSNSSLPPLLIIIHDLDS